MSFKSFLGWLNSDEGKKNDSLKNNEPVTWREKRKENRIDLIPGKELSVHLLSPDSKQSASTLVARVRNISLRGCSLVFDRTEDLAKVQLNSVFVASLAVDDFPIPLSVKVVRVISDNEVGIQFKPPFPKELERLEKFLEPRCLGRSLREIDQSVLQKAPRKGLRWFQGINETSLFSWDNPETNQITQQQLVFLNNVVEWKENDPLKTGRVKEDKNPPEEGVGWVKSELLAFDAKANPQVVKQAQSVLESTEIDSAVKKVFLDKLKS